MKRYLLIAVLIVFASLAQASPLEYRIGVDDILDVGVWNVSEMQKTVAVRSDGKISFPLVNDVVAAGLTPMELRKILTEKIGAYVHNPDVSVVVREIHSQKVSVIGQVHAPGRYDIKGPSTVLDALAMAGGFTDFASRRNIAILRNNGGGVERLQFDYDAAVSKRGAGKNNVVMQPGDIVVVP